MSKRPRVEADADPEHHTDVDADADAGADAGARDGDVHSAGAHTKSAGLIAAEALHGIVPKRARPTTIEARLPALHGVSAPLVDRRSTFVGYYAAVRSLDELRAASRYIRALAASQGADHVIRAWRYKSAAGAGWATDYDDDGEPHAGKRLLEWMKTALVEGLVVCTRVYGGVLLGPVRYSHIVGVCADAVKECNKRKKENTDRLRRLCDARARTIRSLRHAKGVDDGFTPPEEAELLKMGDVELQKLIDDADAEVKRLRGMSSQTTLTTATTDAPSEGAIT